MNLRQSAALEAARSKRGKLASFAGWLCVVGWVTGCGAPEADGDPDFNSPPSYNGNANNVPGAGNLGGSSAQGSSGTSGNPVGSIGGNGSMLGGGTENNPPVQVSTNGGSTNGVGNANGNGNASGAGGAGMVGMAGSGSMPMNPDNTAGAGNAAGAGNVGGTGGTPPVEPPVVLPGGFYLIDDFQGARDPGWTESRVGGTAGTFTLDTSMGANGSSSSVRVDANGVFHTMLQFALPAAVRTANEVYGRVYLRLAAAPSGAHYIWVEVGTTANDGHEMRLGHNVGRLQSNHWLNGEQDIRDRNRQLGANTWYCLEFFMANGPDELRVWLDGEETALSTTNYTAGPNAEGNGGAVADFIPPLEAFRIGWELQNGTVWFDDVALADARIGCE